MRRLFSVTGSILGWSGVLVCGLSALFKGFGYYHLLGMENLSIFIGGLGLIGAGILAKLESRSLD